MQRLLPQKFRSKAQSAPARERLFVHFLVKDRASARFLLTNSLRHTNSVSPKQASQAFLPPPSHKLFFSQINLSRLTPSSVTQTFLYKYEHMCYSDKVL